MSLHVIEKKSNVPVVLAEMTERQEHFDCVMVLAKNKDGTLFMNNSSMTDMERCALYGFLTAYIAELMRPTDP